MFSNTISGPANNRAPAPTPKVRPTTDEAKGAAESEPPRRREDYEKLQRKERATAILGQHDLLMKYAVENGIVSLLP
jgi:hypothetical protein